MTNRDAGIWRLSRDRFELEPGRIGTECDDIVTHQFSPAYGTHEGHLIEVTDVVSFRVHAYCYACREHLSFMCQEGIKE